MGAVCVIICPGHSNGGKIVRQINSNQQTNGEDNECLVVTGSIWRDTLKCAVLGSPHSSWNTIEPQIIFSGVLKLT